MIVLFQGDKKGSRRCYLSRHRQLGEEHCSKRGTFTLFCHKRESLTKIQTYTSNFLSPPSGCPSGSSNSMCLKPPSCSAPVPRPPRSTFVISVTISIISWTEILGVVCTKFSGPAHGFHRRSPIFSPPLESRPWVTQGPPPRPAQLWPVSFLQHCFDLVPLYKYSLRSFPRTEGPPSLPAPQGQPLRAPRLAASSSS